MSLLRTILLVAVLAFSGFPLYGKTVVAFGAMENRSDNKSYDYLETIFANSFANSLRNLFDVDVIKPLKLQTILKTKKIDTKKTYLPYEYSTISKAAGAKMFITGHFTPLAGNRVSITIVIHRVNDPFFFTFTSEGRLETEIFRLVDQIASVMVYYMSNHQLYKTTVIQPGSRVGILTNLESGQLNDLYLPLTGKQYRIVALQGNEVARPVIDQTNIGHFYYVYSKDASYEIINDNRKHFFPVGTWSGQDYLNRVKGYKEIYAAYDAEYIKTVNAVRTELRKVTGIDTLLIIAFNPTGTRAWVRGIDMQTNTVTWLQSEIKGTSVYDISLKIAAAMNLSALDIHNRILGKKAAAEQKRNR